MQPYVPQLYYTTKSSRANSNQYVAVIMYRHCAYSQPLSGNSYRPVKLENAFISKCHCLIQYLSPLRKKLPVSNRNAFVQKYRNAVCRWTPVRIRWRTHVHLNISKYVFAQMWKAELCFTGVEHTQQTQCSRYTNKTATVILSSDAQRKQFSFYLPRQINIDVM